MRTAIVSGTIAALAAIVLIAGAGDSTGPDAYVIIGIANGAIYGLLALGLVLVYKGTRVFNFAQGEFGTIAAFIVFLSVDQMAHLPYGVGVAIALVGTVAIGLLMERVIVRPLLSAPRITLLVATIASSLLAVGIEIMLFLPEAKNLDPIVSGQDASGKAIGVTLFDYVIDPQRIVIIGVLLVLAIVLGYFFSRTDLGLAVLATSQDEFATRVVGIGVERMSRFIWGSAAFLGGVAGILYVPIAGILAPGVVSSNILIPAFTAAVIGGMTSLPGAFVGGVFIGIVEQLASWASGNYHFGDTLIRDSVPGVPTIVLAAVLLLVLLVRPQGLLGSEA